jgi:hypothetical protein
VGLQSSSAAENLRQSSVPMNVAVCKAETCKAEDRATNRIVCLSIDTNAVTQGGKGDGGGEEASVKQHGRCRPKLRHVECRRM